MSNKHMAHQEVSAGKGKERAKEMSMGPSVKKPQQEFKPGFTFHKPEKSSTPAFRFRSSTYKPDMSIFPDPGPCPDRSDPEGRLKWMMGPSLDGWTKEQEAITTRNFCLHHYGTLTPPPPTRASTAWMNDLPAPDDPSFDAAFDEALSKLR